MKKYIIYKVGKNNREVYLNESNSFVTDKKYAKEYRVEFWVDILKIIIEIIRLFGVKSKIKFKEK